MSDKIRLLIVDDEVRFLRTLSSRLELRDFDVTPANTGALALELARSQSFDLALLDLKMPGLSGEEVLKILKRDHPFIAVMPLYRQQELLGYLVVEFDADALFKACFHERIRAEFSFKIEDGARLLHLHSPGKTPARFVDGPTSATRRFQVRNRTWRMSVAARAGASVSLGSPESLPTLIFGLLLSLLVSSLFALFTRQAREKRKARERAEVALRGRAEAQTALRGSEARYRNVFDSASDGLLVVDVAGVIVDANQAACQMHGSEPEALVGQPAEVLVDPAQQEQFKTFFRRIGQTATARIELSGAEREGDTRDVEIKGNLFAYSDTSRVLLILSDVTERKNAQRRLALLSRKVLLAQEEERARVARDLHDELGQIITALRLELDLSRRRLPAPPQTAEDAFRGPIDLLEKATTELRRICEGLRPPLLDDLGVGPAVERLLDRFTGRTGIGVNVEIRIDDDSDVPQEVALTAYRILQEALTNIVRHAEASQVEITLVIDSEAMRLSTYDNGVGFDPGALGTSRGSGIAGMEERARLVGGQLQLHAVQGEGTRVVFEVPLVAPVSGGDT
jgi:PAS domain S-box-containing protein